MDTRRTRTLTAPALLLLCVTTVSLSACSGGSAKSPTAALTVPVVGNPAPPASVEAALGKEAFTPYAGLGQLVNDGLAPNESMASLGDSCIADAGYPGGSADLMTSVRISAGLALSPPYGSFGYVGTTEAAQYGFAPGPVVSGIGVLVGLNAGNGSNRNLPTAEQNAVRRCSNIVSDFDDAQGNSSLATILSLGQSITSDVLADPDVKKATSTWSACMKTDGYNYADPDTEFHNQIQPGTHVTPASPGTVQTTNGLAPAQNAAQIAAAESDAACTSSTDLAGIYFAVQASYEQQLVDANQQKLNAAVQAYRAAYQKELTDMPTLLASASTTAPNYVQTPAG